MPRDFRRGFSRRLTAWALIVPLLGGMPPAAAQSRELLPAEEAFPYIAAAGADTVILSFQLPEGYYLYRHRFGFESLTDDVVLGPPKLPEGSAHEDEFFGAVEIYRGQFEIHLPYARSTAVEEMEFRLELQGCADMGFCYLPMRWDRNVPLPPTGA